LEFYTLYVHLACKCIASEFSFVIKKCNSEGAKKLLENLNAAAKAGNCQICMWILERRFPEDCGRREYHKMNVVSENKNENVEIIVKNADNIRKKIPKKFFRVR
jgi:recombinational DNA repair protein RecR